MPGGKGRAAPRQEAGREPVGTGRSPGPVAPEGNAARQERLALTAAPGEDGDAPSPFAAAGRALAGDPGGRPDDLAGGAGALAEYQAALRALYQQADAAIADEIAYMRSRGVPDEEIAKWAVEARNAAKARIRRWDVLKSWAEQRNLVKYGDALGPSYGQLRSGDPARGMAPRGDGEIIEAATRTNRRVNRWAGRLRIAGRILIAIDLAVSGYRVWKAPPEDRPKVFIREATGLAGALAGGWAGAKLGGMAGAGIGAWFGGAGAAPGAAIGSLIGGLVGAISGAWAGAEAGDWIVDELYPPAETRFEAGS